MTILEKPTSEETTRPEYLDYAQGLKALINDVVGAGETGSPVRHRLAGVNATVVPDVVRTIQTPGSFFADVLDDPFSSLVEQYKKFGDSSIEVGLLTDELVDTLTTPRIDAQGRVLAACYYQAVLATIQYSRLLYSERGPDGLRVTSSMSLNEVSKITLPDNAKNTIDALLRQLICDLGEEPVSTMPKLGSQVSEAPMSTEAARRIVGQIVTDLGTASE